MSGTNCGGSRDMTNDTLRLSIKLRGAAYKGDIEAGRKLISEGADVNGVDEVLRTRRQTACVICFMVYSGPMALICTRDVCQ